MEMPESLSALNILDSLADGVYVTDPDRNIIYWNQSAERITGYRPKEILGKTCYDGILVHTDLRGNTLCGKESCPLHRSIVSGERATFPLILFAQNSDGERVPLQVTVSPIRDARGEIIGGVEVFRDLSQLMQDLERAGKIQKHAMVAPLPEDERVGFDVLSAPLEYVSGDYYRIEAIDENRYAILVADVSGHGVASALYTMQLRALWEDLRKLRSDPHLFTSRMNDHLAVLVQEDYYFATASFGVLDLAAGEFHYTGAGHPRPFLFRADGSLEKLQTRGLPLGMVEGTDYPVQKLALRPGDTLLFYSDAAVELPTQTAQRLEEEGFQQLLEEIGYPEKTSSLDRIEEALLEKSSTLFLGDDLSLLQVHLNM